MRYPPPLTCAIEVRYPRAEGVSQRYLCNTKCSDILFPYRSPSPRPHPDPAQHPETDPKRSQTDPKRTRNGAKRSRNGPKSSFSGWDGRGVCQGRGVGGCKGKRKPLTKCVFPNPAFNSQFSCFPSFLSI